MFFEYWRKISTLISFLIFLSIKFGMVKILWGNVSSKLSKISKWWTKLKIAPRSVLGVVFAKNFPLI